MNNLDNILQGIMSGYPSSETTSSVTYVHKQLIASDSWLITHNLNKFPAVIIVDSANNVVVGDIQYIDSNNVRVNFNGTFSGSAYLN